MSTAADLASLKSKNSAKEQDLNEKMKQISSLKQDQQRVDRQLAEVEKGQQVHDGKIKELSGKFETVVSRMMDDQKNSDAQLAAEKKAVADAKKQLHDVQAQMIGDEVKAKAEVDKLEADKEKLLAAITKQQSDAAAKAVKVADTQASELDDNAETAKDKTDGIYTLREGIANADEAKAELQETIADAVSKVHTDADEESEKVASELAEVDAQIATEYAKTAALMKLKAKTFQQQVEAASALEKEKASASAMGEETAGLQKDLADLQRQVAALDAKRVSALREHTKSAALAEALREKNEAGVADAKQTGLAEEAAARAKEAKTAQYWEKEKHRVQAKITEVQSDHQSSAADVLKKTGNLRATVAAMNAEFDQLESQYRSNRNEHKAAAAKLVIAQPDAHHKVPMTPAGKKRGRE